MREPKYRKHSLRDFGFVEINGRRIRLPGKFNSDESLTARDLLLAKWRQRKADPLPDPPADRRDLTLAELCCRYIAYCDTLIGDSKKCTATTYREAAKKFAPHALGLAHEFGPKKLKEYQKLLAAEGCARSYANALVARVKMMFRWGVSEELVHETVYNALVTVQEIKRGAGLRDVEARDPVPADVFEATAAHLRPHLEAMARLQNFTGIRSRSACLAKPSQFNRSPEIWLWEPRHKGENAGKKLIVPIGPKCQAAIGWLFEKKQPDDYLFSPRDTWNCRRYKEHYSTGSYSVAITAAIEKANKVREKEGLEPIPHWFPHRLRHTVGAAVNDRWGESGAAAMLGHHANVTKLYTQQRLALATQIAAEIG